MILDVAEKPRQRKRPHRIRGIEKYSIAKTGASVTQKDIARLAGVSLTTVYNAMYARELVHPETIVLIESLMREYDYQPNGIARAMVRGKTEIIGIVVPKIGIRFYSDIVSSIENSINAAGYNCIICQHLDDPIKEDRELRMMRERRVDGLIVRASGRREQAELYQQLSRANIPFVLVDRMMPGLEGHFVGNDGFKDSLEITEYLIRKGHNRIATLVWSETSQKMGVKYDGYCHALKRNGIELDQRLVKMCATEYDSGRKETLDLMSLSPQDRPTAILLLNDTSVLGVIQGLLDLGISIPDDVAVACIGGHITESLEALSRLRLTSAYVPCETIGREAARMLLSQIEGSGWQKGPILCPSQIRVGNSA